MGTPELPQGQVATRILEVLGEATRILEVLGRRPLLNLSVSETASPRPATAPHPSLPTAFIVGVPVRLLLRPGKFFFWSGVWWELHCGVHENPIVQKARNALLQAFLALLKSLPH